ncbi:MAG: M48 family metallopeptidase [Pseudomonadota bacterium]
MADPSLTNLELSQWRHHLKVRASRRARHVRLRLLPGGGVELVVPHGFDRRAIPAILDRHEPWVVQQLLHCRHSVVPQAAPPPEQIALAALGEQWRVEYLPDDTGRYGCRAVGARGLRVSGGQHWQPALKRWLSRRAKEQLLPWLEQVSQQTGLAYSGASVRGQRSRWGSCSSRGRINLNYGLLFLAPELVRYLFIHELCHTRHMNHSPRYWRLVASHEPGYRELDRALRRATDQVPAWLHAAEIAPAT